jgi:hypothetical protein
MSTKHTRTVGSDAFAPNGRLWSDIGPDLLEALQAAQQHLEFCGYGDKWERECATEEKLEELINAALAKAGVT